LARRLGATDAQLDAVAKGRYDDFPEGWQSALRYADAATPTRPEVPDDVYAALARAWRAGQIVEITSVIALFNYFNRFAIALRIPPTR
jgi:alkylhydroperoxidase family enzyme